MNAAAESLVIKGRRYADTQAADIVESNSKLTRKIAKLFRAHNSPAKIAPEVRDQMELPKDLKQSTIEGIVRRVTVAVIPEKERKQIISETRSKIAHRTKDAVKQGREAWMEGEGLVVFTDEETEYLFELREEGGEEFKRGTRCNNETIAEEMNRYFETDVFTAENCRQRAANFTLRSKPKKEQTKRVRIFGPKRLARLEQLQKKFETGKMDLDDVVAAMQADFGGIMTRRRVRHKLYALQEKACT